MNKNINIKINLINNLINITENHIINDEYNLMITDSLYNSKIFYNESLDFKINIKKYFHIKSNGNQLYPEIQILLYDNNGEKSGELNILSFLLDNNIQENIIPNGSYSSSNYKGDGYFSNILNINININNYNLLIDLNMNDINKELNNYIKYNYKEDILLYDELEKVFM